MYEELIKRLRNRLVCIQNGGDLETDFPIMKEAADAIDELQASVAWFEATTDVEFVKENGHERIRFVPKWIPVTERLPDKPGKYLVCQTFDYRYGVNQIISVESYSLNLNKVDEYDFHGKKYKRPGWFDYDSEYGHYETGKDITHWMPLPEPPKEETE